MSSTLPASVLRGAQKFYDRPTLVIKSTNPFLVYPRYGVLTTLTIDASVLLSDLRNPALAEPFSIALACVTSLSIASYSDVSHMLVEEVVYQMLDFFKSLTKLKELKIDDFVLPDPRLLPRPLSSSPLLVRDLTVVNTHGPSLDFLLHSIQPRSLLLRSCQTVNMLPICASLTLEGIDAGPGFVDVLSKWNGNFLTIRASPFLDQAFVTGLVSRIHGGGKKLWPDMEEISFEGYPCVVESMVYQMLDSRSQL